MLFNTIDFAVFFPIVLVLYWTAFNRSLQLQNLFLVLVSYVFYAFWDWRFLSLIFLSSLLDYFIGLTLYKSPDRQKKTLLLLSLFFNLGVLFTFKYFNFFIETFIDAFSLFGVSFNHSSWNILLPVGISFYTFQTLSYTIDIYRGKIQPTKNLIQFFAFVSFFPQLVAGPIERASHLLSQFSKKRKFTYTSNVDGLRLILSGLFKKMVIADNCALIVNQIFENYSTLNGSTLFFGAILFAFQIYGDFSGYSDIAIGISRLMGFKLMKNFNFPYLSQNLSDFWRRWHISLSTWFRDYVYIPLGGSKVSKPRVVINIMIVFLISGLWHGANLTFIFWGLIHALFVIPFILFKKQNISFSKNKKWPTRIEFLKITTTFLIVVFSWIFFRSLSLTDAFLYIKEIFSSSLFTMPQIPRSSILFLLIYMIFEWLQRHQKHLMDLTNIKHKWVRYTIYYTTVICIFYFAGDLQPFIYFQF